MEEGTFANKKGDSLQNRRYALLTLAEVRFESNYQAALFEKAWNKGVECMAHMMGVECNCTHYTSRGITHTSLGTSLPTFYGQGERDHL